MLQFLLEINEIANNNSRSESILIQYTCLSQQKTERDIECPDSLDTNIAKKWYLILIFEILG